MRWRPQKENIPGRGEEHIWKMGDERPWPGQNRSVSGEWWEMGRAELMELGGCRVELGLLEER